MSSHPRRKLFNFEIDAVDMNQACETILDWLPVKTRTDFVGDRSDTSGHSHTLVGQPCRFVVTPNVDHAVMLQSDHRLQEAYAAASLVLADGFPLILASRLLGRPLPERVAGSELIPHLFTAAAVRRDLTTVYLLGAMPGVAPRAAMRIEANWPRIEVVGTYSPPFGFEHDPQECQQILQHIADQQPDLLLMGVGAPKQELWVHQYQLQIRARVALCIGATIDFLAGEKLQAPVWMRRSGLEWVHRVASEPKRLANRYARDAMLFPGMLFREWQSRG